MTTTLHPPYLPDLTPWNCFFPQSEHGDQGKMIWHSRGNSKGITRLPEQHNGKWLLAVFPHITITLGLLHQCSWQLLWRELNKLLCFVRVRFFVNKFQEHLSSTLYKLRTWRDCITEPLNVYYGLRRLLWSESLIKRVIISGLLVCGQLLIGVVITKHFGHPPEAFFSSKIK